MAAPSQTSAGNASPATAGAMPYWWFLSGALLVLAFDQAGHYGTVPQGQTHALLGLGLAAAAGVVWLRGRKLWPAVALAGLISGALLPVERGWLTMPLHAASLVAGAAAARWLLTTAKFDSRLRTIADVLALVFWAGPVAAVSAALLAVLPGLMASHDALASAKSFFAVAASGWTGIVLLTPFLFSLNDEYFQRWNSARRWEWLMVNLLLVASLFIMMNSLGGSQGHAFPLGYLSLPFIFWTAWRFGPAGAALANVLVGAVTSLCAWQGLGPFANLPRLHDLLLPWSFLGFQGIVALLLAAVTDERRIELLQQRQLARFLRQVLDLLPCGFLLKNVDDQPLLVNRRWFELFGRPGGTEDDQWKHQQSISPFWRERELALMQSPGERLRLETPSTDAQGLALELLLTKQAAYFDERGERLLMVVADDITSGRTSLTDLRTVLGNTRAALLAAELGLWDWNIPAGTIRFDAQFARIASFAENAESTSVQIWQEGIHPDDRRQFQSALLRHLHHQSELFAIHFRYRRGDAWQWLVVRGRVVEQDVRQLGVRMLGTLQEARANIGPLPNPNTGEQV